ncbi:alpha-L-fucosidase [Sphingobacterium siyangense]
MAWWSASRFGLFIHWGLYSQTAGDWNGRPTRGGEHGAANILCYMKGYHCNSMRRSPKILTLLLLMLIPGQRLPRGLA